MLLWAHSCVNIKFLFWDIVVLRLFFASSRVICCMPRARGRTTLIPADFGLGTRLQQIWHLIFEMLTLCCIVDVEFLHCLQWDYDRYIRSKEVEVLTRKWRRRQSHGKAVWLGVELLTEVVFDASKKAHRNWTRQYNRAFCVDIWKLTQMTIIAPLFFGFYNGNVDLLRIFAIYWWTNWLESFGRTRRMLRVLVKNSISFLSLGILITMCR